MNARNPDKQTTNIKAAERALKSLENALIPPPANDRERDGAIQRFKYTFEAIWKLAQKLLAAEGIQSNSPKSVIRDMAQQGWLTEPKKWLKFLHARNYTSHTYNESVAQWVFGEAKIFVVECTQLLNKLRSFI